MLTQLLQELKDTWGYTTEELNDIREKMEEVANSSFFNSMFFITSFTIGLSAFALAKN